MTTGIEQKAGWDRIHWRVSNPFLRGILTSRRQSVGTGWLSEKLLARVLTTSSPLLQWTKRSSHLSR